VALAAERFSNSGNWMQNEEGKRKRKKAKRNGIAVLAFPEF